VSPETGRVLDDETLVQYLIGGLTGDDVETIDELIVADAEFEVRLRAVEDDLVDAYVNGELTGDTRERFTSYYLTSPAGRTRVEIAEALRSYRRQDAPAVVRRSAAAVWWPLAAAVVLLLAAGLLAIDNVRLRREAATLREHQATLEQRGRQLEEAMNRQQAEIASTSQALTQAREALAAGQAHAPTPGQTSPSPIPRVLAFLLMPANRGTEKTPTIAIPANAGAATVTLRLQLDGTDYPHYTVVVKDADTSRIVWQSGQLRAVSEGTRTMLPALVPASALRPGGYTADVAGVPRSGPSESLDPYPFRVVLQ
jgi:hypothetical protein